MGSRTHQMHTRVLHPAVRILGQLRRRRTTRLRVRPHTVPSLAETQGQKHGAHFRHDTTQDNLFPAGGLDGGAEVRVVPRVDLTVAADEGRVGVHLGDFLGEGTVGTGFGRRGQDGGQVEELAQFGVGEHIVAELGRRVVLDQLEQAELVVDNQEHGFVLVEALEFVGRGGVGCVGHDGHGGHVLPWLENKFEGE